MTWRPGDPIYTDPRERFYSGGPGSVPGGGRQHVRRLMQEMPLGDSEECHCIDRASWPEPWLGTELKPTEALKPLWGDVS